MYLSEDYAVPGELKPVPMEVDYLKIRQFALDAASILKPDNATELLTAAKAIENYLVGTLEDL